MLAGGRMETDEEVLARRRREYEAHAVLLSGLPGADSLVAAYDGFAPSFHDATVEELRLSTALNGTAIRMAIAHPDIFGEGRVIVTLAIGEVVDVDLDHFGRQNILYRLLLRPAVERPERWGYHRPLRADDLELELEASVGVSGYIVCAHLSVSWTKAAPD
jgi:hypothetical protein